MSKPRSKAAKTKGQKAITTFFGGGSKPSAKPARKRKFQVKDNASDGSEPEKERDDEDYVDEPQEEEDEEEDDGVEDEMDEDGGDNKDMNASESEDEVVPKAGRSTAAPPDTSNLPPIYEIPKIFSDIVERTPEMKEIAEMLQGRKIRVATMCSGTESPLLALELIRRSVVQQHDVNIEFEHVFSCEIEPFKQAYIERNFSPPLLFRDVCELGQSHATTAYGSLAPVPGDVDLLIAGTSCVDYSNLNNEKQDLDAHGESGETFRGMLNWVDIHRPPLVILENVCSAPWSRVVQKFESIGYSAQHTKLDTKQYYIPHTRTRGYLLAVNRAGSNIPNNWVSKVKEMKRPASSTLDAFMLPSDDPRIHQAREKLVKEGYNSVDRRKGRTDWGRCESRHQRARLEEQLGSKRPLTNWEDGGYCKLPDFAWNDWGISQVERVWDLMDISLLRSAKTGIDPSYKTIVWNLSQNVDRTIGSNKTGICPCLTPSMIPYISNRGGPMVGLEALSMQGLPVDELLLTRETEDQLADLAGNAMSTTVVGTCMMAAFIVGRKLLRAGDDTTAYEEKAGKGLKADTDDTIKEVAMDINKLALSSESVEDHISGEGQLVSKRLDLSASSLKSLAELLVSAHKSARLCECEGRKDMTDRQLYRCQDCGSSSCSRCGGRPEHNFEPIDVATNPRLAPSAFAKELKSALPMTLEVLNVTQELLDELKETSGMKISPKRWSAWSEAVIRATKGELRFAEPKRQEIWVAIYQSPLASLELSLHPQQTEWRLFAKAEEDEPANSDTRKLLEAPVARFVCTDGLFNGRWEFALPHVTNIAMTIEGSDPVPSWEARLGLQGEEFRDKMVHSRLDISVAKDDAAQLDRDVSGVYVLLDKCGTSNSALHKRIPIPGEENSAPIFMLFDPSRCSPIKEDCFVFSTSKRRYEFGETRPIICQLDSSWRQSCVEGTQSAKCHIPCKWVESPNVRLSPTAEREAFFSVPGTALGVKVDSDACRSANAVLVCRVPLHAQAGTEWPVGKWNEVDKVHERGTFKSLAWLTERTRNVDDRFTEWQEVTLPDFHQGCERCAPTQPAIQWTRNQKRKIVAVEDQAQAGAYERSLKSRPAPFVTQLKLEESGTGTVRIGINMSSLMHRALARLPKSGNTSQVTVSWRLNTDFTPIAKLHLAKFILESNRPDPEHEQPPSFKIPLRPEQLRSLTWMLQQESPDAPPFIEEEISEAILEPLGWRAEGRAQRPIKVRGGVLADQVGYGKTAITLGLIDCTSQEVRKQFAKMGNVKGKIPTKATLVVVPPHLIKQWASEVEKFTKSKTKFKVHVIATASSLNKLSIADIKDADIVVVASSLFKGGVYLQNLGSFSAAGGMPESQEGRYFNARLEKTLEALSDQVELLKGEKGPQKVLETIREASAKGDFEDELFTQTKRLKGKTYRDAKMAQEDSKKEEKPKPARKAVVRNGQIMEVIVPTRPKSNVSMKSSPETSTMEATTADEDSDVVVVKKQKPRRKVKAKETIVISDDDEGANPASSDFEPGSDVEVTKGKKTAKAHYAKRSSKKTSKIVGSDDDSDIMEVDEDVPKGKAKAKAKASSKIAKAESKLSSEASSSYESEGASDSMDVDDAPKTKSKGNSKKRKTSDTDDEAPAKKAPAKKARREDTDPWKLSSSAVKRDYEEMKSPPLEMFYFARKVVDEYTYLEGRAHSVVTRLTAERHWVLSGTPPLGDFGAVKTISAFLGVHLGVDDDGEGESAKKRKREQTDVEKFHSFREVHSLEWHAHRHAIGQAFLDRFVRQNIAEIDEIPCSQTIENIALPAAERAIYLELEHHLRALDMTVKRGRKSQSDREKRVAEALGESASAEEALLKRCSHFDLETSEKKNAMKACEVIVQERKKQLDNCKAELLKQLEKALKQQKEIGKTAEESLFQEYVRVSRTEGVGDKDASDIVVELLEKANIPSTQGTSTHKTEAKNPAKGKGKMGGLSDLTEKQKAAIWEHREHAHEIRRITKELVGRVRSLRYFTVVRDLQRQNEKPPVVSCPRCGRTNLPIDDIAVLSSCGHMGCVSCVKESADREECVYAAGGVCKAAARSLNVVLGSTLGVDDVARDGKGRHFGMKLEKIIELIKTRIPKTERVLIFVQFKDLTKKVSEALDANGIPHLEIVGSAAKKSKNLETFQNGSKERVLLLNVMDESASGANLTGANHAIFISPLLAPTQDIYDACETQAIGRLRRYGQTKHVNIWRFLSADTIDYEIYEQRTRKSSK